MTLFVLVILAVSMNLAAAQYSFVLFSVKGSNGYWRGAKRNTALVDGPHLVRIHGQPYSGTLHPGEERMTYQWEWEKAAGLAADRVIVKYPQQTHWPSSIGLWIQTPNLSLYLKDFE